MLCLIFIFITVFTMLASFIYFYKNGRINNNSNRPMLATELSDKISSTRSKRENFIVRHFGDQSTTLSSTIELKESFKKTLLNFLKRKQTKLGRTTSADKRVTVFGLVMRRVNNLAYIYSPHLDLSYFCTKSVKLKLSTGHWYKLKFSPDTDVNTLRDEYFDGWKIDVQEAYELEAPPIQSRLVFGAENVEVLVRLFVGPASTTDCYRTGFSFELPPIIDVTCKLSGKGVGSCVLAWCTLRRISYDGCYWRILRLADLTLDRYENYCVDLLQKMSVRNVKQAAINKILPKCEASLKTTNKGKLQAENPVLRLISSTALTNLSKIRKQNDLVKNKESNRKPIINNAVSSKEMQPPCSPVWLDEEYAGVVCAHLDIPASNESIRNLGALPALGDVDYIVQTPALKTVAILKGNVALAQHDKISFKRTTSYGVEVEDYNNLIGEWILFKGYMDGQLLIVCSYKIIESCLRTMPSRFNVWVSCEVDIPENFNAAYDVIMVDQLGAAVFDMKSRIQPIHVGKRSVHMVVGCDLSLRSPDLLVWWIESVRSLTANNLF